MQSSIITKHCKQLKSMITQCCELELSSNHFYPGKTTCKACTCLEQRARREIEQKISIDAEELLSLNQLKAEKNQLKNDLEDEKLKTESLTQTVQNLQEEKIKLLEDLNKFKDEYLTLNTNSLRTLSKFIMNMDIQQKHNLERNNI